MVYVIAPSFIVILLGFRIPTRERTRLRIETIARLDQASGVGVMDDVFALVELVVQDVLDQTAVEGDVGTRTDTAVVVGTSSRAGVTRVNHDPLSTLILGTFDPTGRKRMVFHVVRTDREEHVGVGQVTPVTGHGATTEGTSKSRHRGGVANTGLVIDSDNAQVADELLDHPSFFGVQLSSTERGDTFATVNRYAIFFFNEGGITGLLDATSNFIDGLFPGQLRPFLGTRTAHHRMQHACRVILRLTFFRHDIAKAPHGGALRAKTTKVDRMFWVAFKVDQLATT